jgi:signal transduction histidine kinase
VALVLRITGFGGYLLLRDVNRDTRINEVRSQFVASVSHELKTPLTAIRMYAETLAMGRTRDEESPRNPRWSLIACGKAALCQRPKMEGRGNGWKPKAKLKASD